MWAEIGMHLARSKGRLVVERGRLVGGRFRGRFRQPDKHRGHKAAGGLGSGRSVSHNSYQGKLAL